MIQYVLKMMCRRVFVSVPRRCYSSWRLASFHGPEGLQRHREAGARPRLRGPQEVLVEVEATSLNPIDLAMTRGEAGGGLCHDVTWRVCLFIFAGYGATVLPTIRRVSTCSSEDEDPLVLGRDFAGRAVEVGPDVKAVRVGDPVWGATFPSRAGSQSDYVIASSPLVQCSRYLVHFYMSFVVPGT